MINAAIEGLCIGIGIPIGIALLFVLAVFTQDMGIWRPAPREYENP